MSNPRWLDQLSLDARRAVRRLSRAPALTLVAAGTLALGIGTSTAIFSVFEKAVLQPLPYAKPDELVTLWQRDLLHGQNDKVTGGDLADWRARARSFSQIGFAWDVQYTLAGSGGRPPQSLRAFQFSANLFALLGARPALGRVFGPGDDQEGADHLAVLSHHLWETAFDAAPDVVGRVIQLDGAPYTVIGVMPASFAHPDRGTDLWTPLAIPPGLARNRTLHAFQVVARLRPGVRLLDAAHELSSIAAANARQFPPDARYGASVQPLRETYLGTTSAALWVLQSAVLLILFSAAANVASLLLARAASGERELAIRLAIGATRADLVRQGAVEGLSSLRWGQPAGWSRRRLALMPSRCCFRSSSRPSPPTRRSC